jgi:hypothetical protein
MNYYPTGTHVRIRQINDSEQNAPATVAAGPMPEWRQDMVGFVLLPGFPATAHHEGMDPALIALSETDIIEMDRS